MKPKITPLQGTQLSLIDSLVREQNRTLTNEEVLSQLPFLPLSERDKLPNFAAVYIVATSNKILYIGSTEHLWYRWKKHELLRNTHRSNELLNQATLEKVRVYWIAIENIDLLSDLEIALIRHLKPVLNRIRYLPKEPKQEANNPDSDGSWIEEKWIQRSGKLYGPYRYKRWRQDGKLKSKYLGRVDQDQE